MLLLPPRREEAERLTPHARGLYVRMANAYRMDRAFVTPLPLIHLPHENGRTQERHRVRLASLTLAVAMQNGGGRGGASSPLGVRPSAEPRQRSAKRAMNPNYLERYNVERRAEYRAGHPSPTRPCVVCDKPFTGRPDALVCGQQRQLEPVFEAELRQHPQRLTPRRVAAPFHAATTIRRGVGSAWRRPAWHQGLSV